jgi:hypothetical protein
MIRIAISEAAFQAIASTMPLGSVGYEAELGPLGQASTTDVRRALTRGFARQPRLLAVGQRNQKLRQLRVGAMHGNEPLDVIAPVPAAPLAADRERRRPNFGQEHSAVARLC